MKSKFGVCRLCGSVGYLKKSHLLPRAAYGRLREGGRDPILITHRSAVQMSTQIVTRLLCSRCESRFDREGEGWVLKYCYDRKRFRLPDILGKASPLYSSANLEIFAGNNIPQVKVERITYFAASVFWRAGAAEWPQLVENNQKIDVPCLEHLRRYLLGEQSFPDSLALWVAVSQRQSPAFMIAPWSQVIGLDRICQFNMLGMTFILFSSNLIPLDYHSACIAHSRDGIILVGARVEELHLDRFLDIASRVPARGKLARVGS